MERRDFLKCAVRGGLVLGGIALGLPLIGCKDDEINPKTVNINGITYKIQGGVISQETKGDNKLKLGVMADLHAHQDNSQYFADQLNKEGVEAYFLAGDLSHSFGDTQGTRDDYEETVSVIEPVAKTGKLTLVIPGNHEPKKAYSKALEHLTSKYSNVIDMEQIPVANLDDLTIIALGGNANPRFCIPKGFLRNKSDFEELRELVKKHQEEKPILIGTHAPRRYSTLNGLDVILDGRNVGLFEYFPETHRASGHIHEAQRIITPKEQIVKPGELVDLIEFNPGAVYDHTGRAGTRPSAGIMEFIGKQAKAYILNR